MPIIGVVVVVLGLIVAAYDPLNYVDQVRCNQISLPFELSVDWIFICICFQRESKLQSCSFRIQFECPSFIIIIVFG